MFGRLFTKFAPKILKSSAFEAKSFSGFQIPKSYNTILKSAPIFAVLGSSAFIASAAETPKIRERTKEEIEKEAEELEKQTFLDAALYVYQSEKRSFVPNFGADNLPDIIYNRAEELVPVYQDVGEVLAHDPTRFQKQIELFNFFANASNEELQKAGYPAVEAARLKFLASKYQKLISNVAEIGQKIKGDEYVKTVVQEVNEIRESRVQACEQFEKAITKIAPNSKAHQAVKKELEQLRKNLKAPIDLKNPDSDLKLFENLGKLVVATASEDHKIDYALKVMEAKSKKA